MGQYVKVKRAIRAINQLRTDINLAMTLGDARLYKCLFAPDGQPFRFKTTEDLHDLEVAINGMLSPDNTVLRPLNVHLTMAKSFDIGTLPRVRNLLCRSQHPSRKPQVANKALISVTNS